MPIIILAVLYVVTAMLLVRCIRLRLCTAWVACEHHRRPDGTLAVLAQGYVPMDQDLGVGDRIWIAIGWRRVRLVVDWSAVDIYPSLSEGRAGPARVWTAIDEAHRSSAPADLRKHGRRPGEARAATPVHAGS